MTDIELVRNAFAKDLFATNQAGIIIDEVSDGYSKCSMEITANHMNAAGTVMGGAICTLADLGFAVAANYKKPLTVTLSTNINFLYAPREGKLYCETKLLNETKKTCVYECTVTDNNGRIVAKATSTGFKKDTPPSGSTN